MWNQNVDSYGQRLTTMEDNMGAMFSLIKDKISKIMKAKVKSKVGYKTANSSNNVIWLLKEMDDIVLKFEETKPLCSPIATRH